MKNDYEVRGEVTAIFLKKKDGTILETLIDTEDLEKAKEFPNTWYSALHPHIKTYYVNGNPPKKDGIRTMISLHRFLTDCPRDQEVDHFNHDTLDNRRSINLRVLNHAQNQQNKKGASINNKSGFRGVCWDNYHKSWMAHMEIDGKFINLGLYKNIEVAKIKVLEARKKFMPYSQDGIAN